MLKGNSNELLQILFIVVKLEKGYWKARSSGFPVLF